MVESPPAGTRFDDLLHIYSHPSVDERTWRDAAGSEDDLQQEELAVDRER